MIAGVDYIWQLTFAKLQLNILIYFLIYFLFKISPLNIYDLLP
ncbi:hypothetical protein DSUL_20178 [Desulfovibrionales bacterium]